jgi:hypothetical protein
MVVDFDLVKLKDMQLCQLVVDELRVAIQLWQATGDKPGALPGCVIAPILAYLDCLNHHTVDRKNKNIPHAIHFEHKNLLNLAKLVCFNKGSWIYEKLPVRSYFFYF